MERSCSVHFNIQKKRTQPLVDDVLKAIYVIMIFGESIFGNRFLSKWETNPFVVCLQEK